MAEDSLSAVCSVRMCVSVCAPAVILHVAQVVCMCAKYAQSSWRGQQC